MSCSPVVRLRTSRPTDRIAIIEYGRHKADAERVVTATIPEAAIIRTSLLYGTDHLSPFQIELAHSLRAGSVADDVLQRRIPLPRARRRRRRGDSAGRHRPQRRRASPRRRPRIRVTRGLRGGVGPSRRPRRPPVADDNDRRIGHDPSRQRRARHVARRRARYRMPHADATRWRRSEPAARSVVTARRRSRLRGRRGCRRSIRDRPTVGPARR